MVLTHKQTFISVISASIAIGTTAFIALIQESNEMYTGRWWILLCIVVLCLLTLCIISFREWWIKTQLWRKKLNIKKVYNNRKECEEEIKRQYKETKKCKMLVLRGMSDFVVSGTSLFYSLSTEDEDSINRKKGTGCVKVLLAYPDSKFFSSQRYDRINKVEDLNKDSKKTKTDIKSVVQRLEWIKEKINLQYKFFTEGFLCKFYLFDNVGFVVFNDRSTKIDEETPILCVEKCEVGGMYNALDRYFDFLWDFQSINPDQKQKAPRKKSK